MGFMRLFLGKSAKSHNDVDIHSFKSSPYESTTEQDAPIRGSYPVAGNGPDILDAIQRAHATQGVKSAGTVSRSPNPNSIAIPPNVSRHRDGSPDFERPRTAPHPALARRWQVDGGRDVEEKMKTVFSAESSSHLSLNKRNPTLSRRAPPTPLPIPIPELPTPRELPASRRAMKTYQSESNVSVDTGFNVDDWDHFTLPPVLPLFSHARSASQASRKSHVDVLDAQFAIDPSQTQEKRRVEATGLRHYGEDVANRNLAGKGDRESPYKIAPLQLNYLRSVSAPSYKRNPGNNLAQSYGLGPEGNNMNDDIIQPLQTRPKASTIRSATTSSLYYPSRVDSANLNGFSQVHHYVADLLDHTEERGRRTPNIVPVSSVYEPTSRPSSVSPRDGSTPPLLGRGRVYTSREHPPVSLNTHRVASPLQTSQSFKAASQPNERQRSSSSTSFGTARASSATGTKSMNGSIPQSTFSNMNPSREHTPSRNTFGVPSSRSPGTMAQSKEPLSLEGVVDLSNTVDSKVTTKTLPAVTQERILPTRHDLREERITREIHTHDIFHHILPVIETEILPTKHYIPSADGKSLIEVQEHMTPSRATQRSSSEKWQIAETDMGRDDRRRYTFVQSSNNAQVSEEDWGGGAEAPHVPLHRENRPTSRRASFNLSSLSIRSKSLSRKAEAPALISTKENTTKDGIPRIEYVWRHPPEFETVDGKTYPISNSDLLNLVTSQLRLSEESGRSDDDIAGKEYGAEATPSKREGENHLLFQDPGYGPGGTLPGLKQKTRDDNGNSTGALSSSGDEFDEKIRLEKVMDDAFGIGRGQREGEVSKRKPISSAETSKSTGKIGNSNIPTRTMSKEASWKNS